MSMNLFERELIRMNDDTIIKFLSYNNLLSSGRICENCCSVMVKKKYVKVKEKSAWQCTNTDCTLYRKMISIRRDSFFENLYLPFLDVLQVIIKWSSNIPQSVIVREMEIDHKTFKKIIQKLLLLINKYDNDEMKFGGPGKIVQADETALNHKIKAHRGRAPRNKTDALCIVEYDTCITRAFACVIENKSANIIIPIICKHVEKGSIIWTDEHKSYGRLNSIGYIHDTVCHKYEFINQETGVNTQAVESLNNELNLEIKRCKGVATHKRPEFLKEFVWKFNNKEQRFLKIWELLKIRN